MSKQLTLKVPFLADGVARDVVTVVVGKDNSFYCRLERPGNASWRVPRVTVETGIVGSSPQGLLDFENYEERTFALNKISFHPSGVIHQTDTAGKRWVDGISGLAFAEMELPYRLCAFFPCLLTQFNEFTRKKRWYHVALVNLGEFRDPFGLDFWVIDREHQLKSMPGEFVVGPMNFNLDGFKFGLAMTIQPVVEMIRPEPPPWPPFPFMLFRHRPKGPSTPVDSAGATLAEG